MPPGKSNSVRTGIEKILYKVNLLSSVSQISQKVGKRTRIKCPLGDEKHFKTVTLLLNWKAWKIQNESVAYQSEMSWIESKKWVSYHKSKPGNSWQNGEGLSWKVMWKSKNLLVRQKNSSSNKHHKNYLGFLLKIKSRSFRGLHRTFKNPCRSVISHIDITSICHFVCHAEAILACNKNAVKCRKHTVQRWVLYIHCWYTEKEYWAA